MKWRKPTLDPQVRDQLELGPRERVLAWADDGAGRLIVASQAGLHLQRTPPLYSRIGWEQIERATYDSGTLAVTLVPQLDSATLRVPVGDARDLPVVVRDRVTASVLVDRFVPLDGDAGVRIVGRRAADGVVTWRTDVDPGLAGRADIDDVVKGALADVRGEVGEG
jgi:hypothetical protein